MPGARPSILRGNQALARGDWVRARASFSAALRRAEVPEALEGLGAAAWWLDDARTLFDARERAYRLYRARGDRRGAGRVATMIAGDYLQFRGEAAVARGWHRRAHRLLDGLPAIPEQGWLKVFEGDLALVLGEDPARVRELGVEAAAVGRELGDTDLEMTGLALEGLALVVAGELAEGMARLDEATTAAMSGDMSDRVAIGLSCCYLVMACERIRDFSRAAEWCRRVREFCERTGFAFLLAVCRAQYAGVLTWRGAWAEAEAELQTVLRQFAATRPAMQEEALARLAELRRQQGRLSEAALLLEQVHEASPQCILGRAGLALDRGDAAQAADLAQRRLRQVPAANRTDRVGALEVLLRAHLALGLRKEARASLDELRAIAAAVATEPLRASALIAEGLVALAEGDPGRARDALEDAASLLSRSGASLELARCGVEVARALAALRQPELASAELRKALALFQRLGAGGDVATAGALLAGLASGAGAEPRPAGLTPREVEVLRLVARGLRNRQIASRLGVSEFTIKRHVANLLTKLDLPSRAAAAAYAARERVI